ncbi:MAG TPA: hypothetical protein VN081_00175 [Dongiaceae bacterium]|nr:hypothetical protein [Dongiaceae bacterium]
MAKTLSSSELIATVLASFEAERTNDVDGGLKLLHPDFKKTSVLIANDQLFPRLEGEQVLKAVKAAYQVQGRQFHIFNTAADEVSQTAFIELVEIEPRGEATALWPYVLVCQFDDGLIYHTRHYGDPAVLARHLQLEDVETLYQ